MYHVVDYPTEGSDYWTSKPQPQLKSWWSRRRRVCAGGKKKNTRSQTSPNHTRRESTDIDFRPLYTDDPLVYTIAKITNRRPVYRRKFSRLVKCENREYFVHFTTGESQWVDERDIDRASIENYDTSIKKGEVGSCSTVDHVPAEGYDTLIGVVDTDYDTYKIQSRGHKHNTNTLFVHDVRSLLASQPEKNGTLPGTVVILDGEDGNTTRRLLEVGITSPITAVNFSGRVVNKIIQNLGDVENVRVMGTTIGQTLQHAGPESVSCIWFDYCSTWNGTCDVDPRKDIKSLFQRGVLREHVLLALTVSLRDARLRGRMAKYRPQQNKIKASIRRRLRMAGYTEEKSVEYRYGTMYFLSFTILKTCG